jgi:hypothetical protein
MYRRVAPFGGAVRVYGDPIMRTTVGPLPSAVYWRRRAVVLGALLLGVIVLFVSCSGGDDKNTKRGTGAASRTSMPAPAKSTPDATPSFSDANPNAGPSLPAPGDLQSGQPSLGGTADGSGTGSSSGPGQNPDGTNANANAPSGDTCADAEMSVTPVPAATSVKRGSPLTIRLRIKNIGSRTCKRDVGADPQELYIDQGARKYWSSDTCSNLHGSDVETFQPGAVREFTVTWNGRQTSKCSGGLAAGPTPIAGNYEVRGRLGVKISDPAILTIVA